MADRNTLMSARGLTKRFGGLAAVNDVSLELWLGQIHAVIGPNGAGKSTLANLLSGDLPPTSGRMTLGETDITGWTPEKISRHGLGRSYQKPTSSAPSACGTTCAWRRNRVCSPPPSTPWVGGVRRAICRA
jgi:branched-chain amino acid transport system ATP-binding protein